MIDLSKAGKSSITSKVEGLIGRMEKMDYSAIRKEFNDILTSDDTYVSTATCQKWTAAMEQQTSKLGLMRMITNLYLGGCNLKVLVL